MTVCSAITYVRLFIYLNTEFSAFVILNFLDVVIPDEYGGEEYEDNYAVPFDGMNTGAVQTLDVYHIKMKL